MNIKKINPNEVDIERYNTMTSERKIIRNLDGLRFGRIAIASDQDLDGRVRPII
jgi:DNA gyrase/topoisomerase IV subunit B